jgi:hypothetical protein
VQLGHPHWVRAEHKQGADADHLLGGSGYTSMVNVSSAWDSSAGS